MRVLLCLVLALSLTTACGKKKKKKNAPVEGVVSSVTITNPGNGNVVPNQALTVYGICVATANGAPVAITIGTITKIAACNNGSFSVGFTPSDIVPGAAVVSANNGKGVGLANHGFIISPCTSFQDFDGVATCTDRPIQNAAFSVAGVTNVTGTDFVTSPTLSLGLGTTVDAKKIHIFNTASDCNDYLTNSCQLNASLPACLAITNTTQNAIAPINFSSALSLGVSGDISVLYTNETQTSSCLVRNLVLDNAAPTLNISLASAITYDPQSSAQLIFNGGAVTDPGNSGVAQLEVGLGTSASSADKIPLTAIPNNGTNLTLNSISPSLLASTNYYLIVRATDALGNTVTTASSAFTHVACGASQTLTSGSCVDNAIATPQFLITNGSVVGSDRFVTTNALTISTGTTAQAQKTFIFDTAADCNSHRTANCYLSASNPGCSAITAQESTPGTAIAYNSPTLSHGGTLDVSGYHVNGTQISSCLSQTVKMDNLSPSIGGTLVSAITHDFTVAPRLNFTGSTISDRGQAGVSSLEYGISSNGTSDDLIPFTSLSLSAANVTASLSSATIEASTPYYYIIRARDNLNQENIWVSPAFTAEGCGPTQTPSGSTCSDNPITTPQFSITSGTVLSSNRYTTSSSLTLSYGTTSQALDAHLFNSLADCNAHLSASCFEDSSNPGCSAITAAKNAIANTNYTASLTQGSQHVIAAYFANGTESTSCLTASIELDTQGPSVSGSLSRSVINDPTLSPTLNFGGVIADQGNSGLATLEYGVSTDGTNADVVAMTNAALGATSVTPDLSSATIAAATNYYILVKATDALGNVTNFASGAFTYQACAANQNLTSGNCVDKPIATPQFLITSGTVISSSRFTVDNSLTLSSGTTADAQKMFIMNSLADCNAHRTANCSQNASNPGCSAITTVETTPGTSIAYTSSLSHGSPSALAAYYSNGTATSSCIAQNIELDNLSPNASGALARTVTNDINSSPILNITGGSFTDRGNAGIQLVEYAVSSDGTTDNVVAFTSVAASSSSITANLSSATIAPSTNYYLMLRATDNLNHVTNWVSPAWTYVACGSNQTLTSGSCVDNDIVTPQILITSGTDISSSRFTTDRNLVLSMGTTSQALRAIIVKSSADCSAHIANGCYTASPQPACLGISAEEFTPSLTMNFNYSDLVSGTPRDVVAYYVNGTKTSACVTRSITLDTSAPNPAIALASTKSTLASESVQLNFTNAPIPDVGGAGVDTLEVGIGTSTASPNVLALTSIPTSSTSYKATSQTLSLATDYFFFVKATDKLGNTTTINSAAWRYDPCNATYQNTQPNGTCTNVQYACAISNGTGSQEWTGSGSTMTTCTVVSCNSGYKANAGNTACSLKACSESMSSTELANMGLKTNNSTGVLAGTNYPSCTLAGGSCNAGYAMAIGSKRCLPATMGIKVALTNYEGLFFKNGSAYSTRPITSLEGLVADLTPPTNSSTKYLPSISPGRDTACAVTVAGKVYCSNSNINDVPLMNNPKFVGPTTTPEEMMMVGDLTGKTVKRLVRNNQGTFCVIASDDLVYCWGDNTYGTVGNPGAPTGSGAMVTEPLRVGETGALAGKTIKQLTQNCVIASDDLAYCWGRNDNGAVGDNTTVHSSSPILVAGVLAGKTIKEIDSNGATVCAIASDNKAYCWGDNTWGQIGDGSTTIRLVPTAVSASGVLSGKNLTKISVGSQVTCAVDTAGALYCWGNSNGATVNTLQNGGAQSNSPVAVGMTGTAAGKLVKDVRVLHQNIMVLTTDGMIAMNGNNANGALGRNIAADTTTAYSMALIHMTGEANGKTFKDLMDNDDSYLPCALSTDDLIYCWGAVGLANRLLDPTLPIGTGATAPRLYADENHLDGKTIKDISGNAFSSAANRQQICVIASDDKPYCWGGYAYSTGTFRYGASRPVPVDMTNVPGGTAKKVVISGSHACLIGGNNLAYCWGPNQTATGSATAGVQYRPIAVNTSGVLSGKTIKDIAAGFNYTCVIASDDLGYCWGTNSNGVLGDASTTTRTAPVAISRAGVLSGKTMKKISGGYQQTCAIASDNMPYCWGQQLGGRLGNNVATNTNATSPTAVVMNGELNGLYVLDIAIAGYGGCVIGSNYDVYCWGDPSVSGSDPSLGGATPTRAEMGGVLAGRYAISLAGIATTSGAACVITDDNFVACWGTDSNTGRLATGAGIAGFQKAPVDATLFNSVP